MMNTFKYLWLAYLDPHNIPQKEDDNALLKVFVGLKNSMNTTLGMFFLCSDGAKSISYLNDNAVGLVTLRNKYKFLKYILQNKCLSESQKDDFICTFQVVQKHYFAFSRLAYIWKWKRAFVTIETDLFLNTIDDGKSNSFILYQGKTKFYFIISDLMRLMEMAIWQNWDGCFRVESQSPTNPYTKQEFSAVDLYNIYYHMKWKMDIIIIPQFFHLWFLEDFCFTTFKRNNALFIRKMCIRQFTKTTSEKNQMLYKNVQEMLADYYYTCKWKIHEDFPRKVLVDAMRPYLYLHYLISFDIVGLRQASHYEILLNRALIRFFNFNKLFGRKVIPTTPSLLFHKSYFNPDCCKELVYQVKTKDQPAFYTESLDFPTWHF